MLISLLFENPILFFCIAASLIVSISIHEFAHAFAAVKLGDPTPKYMGRLTLNPSSHLHPVGTLMLLFAGFGWGNPVGFNPINLNNPRRDTAIIALAGPLSNFILALVAAIIMYVSGARGLIGLLIYFVIFYNLILGFFNLIPVHPLDGFKIVRGFLPLNLAIQWDQMASFGIFFLMLLIFTGAIQRFILPLIGLVMQLLGLH